MLNACPVCLNVQSDSANVNDAPSGWGYRVHCPVCGRFEIARETWDDFLDPQSAVGRKLTEVARARLAHVVRTTTASGGSIVHRVTSDFLERFMKNGFRGPLPAEQATKAICFIGDFVSEAGEHLDRLPVDFYVAIGAPTPAMAGRLAIELQELGLISGQPDRSVDTPPNLLNVGLTLQGWERYEAEKRGRIAGKHGFIAMKFNDHVLDPFVENVVKPTVREGIGYEVLHMRDVARAGIIDNIMRAQIRDVAFVIVDLTHDNSGAYWEAGYAEGLGKPVIYICERSKFDEARTHFDTNHCTTVLWSADDGEDFGRELIATLRRSLNLFPGVE